jgi:hypothetical protein
MGFTDNPCVRSIAANFGLGATLGSSLGKWASSVWLGVPCLLLLLW